ncbi:DUF1918 domain-containing protein [Myceligenerans indicum]|uniref:DUF1918 domain-containing protein n=1 Tax=Myceligenerans indicum TaxID=2593663 RepID=A0ABS1LL52_9MICO|nr:DUF1918 domain-containing protein [Myceligenerans indicum]MBL0886956.1 DUF1918 domain-containing protein [Myceligenerans indicum]
MWARTGDRLVVQGHELGEPVRDGEVLEVRGPDGSPPYLVQWSDSGRTTLVFPGSDAVVQHFGGPDDDFRHPGQEPHEVRHAGKGPGGVGASARG